MSILFIRRTVLTTCLVAAFSGLGAAQIALVNVTSCNPVGASPATCTIPSTGAGHLIVIGVEAHDSTATIGSISDSAGNAYAEAGAARAVAVGGSINVATDLWYAKNSLAGATSITITLASGAAVNGAVIWEYSGADLTSPLDQAMVLNSQPSSATIAGASVTTASANEVIVSISSVEGAVSNVVSGNPFSSDSTLLADGWAHFITSSSGTYSAAWLGPAGVYDNTTASFKAAPAAPVISSCDLNNDGAVNVVDVQLITNMEIGATGFTTCNANIGGVLSCTDPARQVVIKAALGQGCHFISLNWLPSPSSGVIGYNIYRGTASGAESSTPLNTNGPVSGTSYIDVNTVSGRSYFYWIKATDGTTESGPSNESSATTN